MADTLVQSWAAARPRGVLAGLIFLPYLWIARAGRRNELMTLDPEQMHDCGLDPIAVRREALKPFWRD